LSTSTTPASGQRRTAAWCCCRHPHPHQVYPPRRDQHRYHLHPPRRPALL
jgi:hypothetical protein